MENTTNIINIDERFIVDCVNGAWVVTDMHPQRDARNPDNPSLIHSITFSSQLAAVNYAEHVSFLVRSGRPVNFSI
jgi:hypothetical protein